MVEPTLRTPSVMLMLDGHCIETAARARHREILEMAACGQDIPAPLQEEAAFLQEFLETTDFRALRATRPDLDSGAHTLVRVERGPTGFLIRPAGLFMTPIGLIRTPFLQQAGTPIQGALAKDIEGEVQVLSPYREGLRDLEGFTHVILLYIFDRVQGYKLIVRPYLDTCERGLFATRAPARPNPIGLTVVRLIGVDHALGRMRVAGVDMLDRTPLLDIKPYIPEFEPGGEVRAGWYERVRPFAHKEARVLADDRFDRVGPQEDGTTTSQERNRRT